MMISKIRLWKRTFILLVSAAIVVISIILGSDRIHGDEFFKKFLKFIRTKNGNVKNAIRNKIIDMGKGYKSHEFYAKLPKLHFETETRERNLFKDRMDLSVGLKSEWPLVPLESALFEFMVDYYFGIGKSIEELIVDLVDYDEVTDDESEKLITTKKLGGMINDNLTIKFMEVLTINRWYSSKIESTRMIERKQRELLSVSCKEVVNNDLHGGWVIVIYGSTTFDIYCSINTLFKDIVQNGRKEGFERVEDYDLSLSRVQSSDENIIGDSNTDSFLSGYDIIVYLDVSSNYSKLHFVNILKLWEGINSVNQKRETNRITIRHMDTYKNKYGQESEYIMGYTVYLKKYENDTNFEIHDTKMNENELMNTRYRGVLNKTHIDEEYETMATVCDKALNMENVLNIDGEVGLTCMNDIGTNIVSVSKRFENPIKSMIHYLENMGTYQLAFCNSVRDSNITKSVEELHKNILKGSTMIGINGRLFSPKDTDFFTLVPILKRIIFSRMRLLRNNINDNELLIDSISNNGVNEDENLDIFVENINDVNSKNSTLINRVEDVILDVELRKQIEGGEVYDLNYMKDFEKELEEDLSTMEELDWVGREEYTLSSSNPWTKRSPRTDWRITGDFPKRTSTFYRDISNIGDNQWAHTPSIFEKVWFHRNKTENGTITEEIEFSPWMMYRIYFDNQLKSAKMAEEYLLYDIMVEPENTLGQALHPLERLPELYELYPSNFLGLYPVRATILNIVMLCDPLDIECMTVVINLINKKLPIKLNLLLIDPEWVNSRKPDYSSSFSYGNITTEEEFREKFKSEYIRNRKRLSGMSYCEKYFREEEIATSGHCPSWMNKLNANLNKSGSAVERELKESSTGSYAIKVAISEVFGFFLSTKSIQGMFLARSFLEMIAKNLPLFFEPDFTLAKFGDFLDTFFKHFKINADLNGLWEVIYSNNPNDLSSYVTAATSYCRTKGLTYSSALINGYHVDIHDLSLSDELIYRVGRRELKKIIEGVKLGKIMSDEDIPEYLLRNVTGINTVPVVFPPFTRSLKLKDWPYYGFKKGWNHVQREINGNLQNRYSDFRDNLGKRANSKYKVNNDMAIRKRVYNLNSDELSLLEYSVLWDVNPEIKQSNDSVEKRVRSTPWMTFVVVVRCNKPGLLGLLTIIDYWISTVSLQASLRSGAYNDILYNRRFSILFISSSSGTEGLSEDLVSKTLQECMHRIFAPSRDNVKRTVPAIERLRFASWFIRVVIETLESALFSQGNADKMIMEILTSLSRKTGIELYQERADAHGKGNGSWGEIYNHHLENESVKLIKEKLVRKFSLKQEYWEESEDLLSFPVSSDTNVKLKGYPKHVNYNLSKKKGDGDSEYGKATFRESTMSNKDCGDVFSVGIVLNGVYLRVCPHSYPVYIRKDTELNNNSPLHSVHLKTMELAVSTRMRQLVLLGERNRNIVDETERARYRSKWSNLSPNEVFVLLGENLYVSNIFSSVSLLQLGEIYKRSKESIKLHLPGLKGNKRSLVNVVAVVDPVTDTSAGILRLLDVLHRVLESDIKIVYNPVLEYRSMGEIVLLNTWRRYVFNYPNLLNKEEIGYSSSANKSWVLGVKLYDLLHSSPHSSGFGIGDEGLYEVNTQMFGKFDVATRKRVKLMLENKHSWNLKFHDVVVDDSDTFFGKSYVHLFPNNVHYHRSEVLYIYKLVGLRQEASIMHLSEEHSQEGTEDIKQVRVSRNSMYQHDPYSHHYHRDYADSTSYEIYSPSEFNTFYGIFWLGVNDLVLRKVQNENKLKRKYADFYAQVFTSNIYLNENYFVLHNRDIASVRNKTTYETNHSSNGILKTLNVLLVSLHNSEISENVIDGVIGMIENGCMSGSQGYNNYVIYMDNKYVSHRIKEYISFKTYWKYYIKYRYINMALPKWLPELSVEINNSFLNSLLTLDLWVPGEVEKLLFLDPLRIRYGERGDCHLVDRMVDMDNASGKSVFHFERRSTAGGDTLNLDTDLSSVYSNLTARVGLVDLREYSKTKAGYWIKQSYLELFAYFEYVKEGHNSENKCLSDLFVSYLSRYLNTAAPE